MNEQSITIRWDKNPDGSTDISVSVDIDGQTYFREAFLSWICYRHYTILAKRKRVARVLEIRLPYHFFVT